MGGSAKRFDLAGRRVWVAGHRGMVGSALVRRLAAVDCTVLTVPRSALDLRRQAEVEAWMAESRPEAVFLAAGTVGGIQANAARPAEFCHDNLAIADTVIAAAHRTGVAKLMVLGSSCIYPRLAEQPMREDCLWTGPLEPTNEGYAVAKLAAITLAASYRRQYGCDFISVIPAGLYGPGDNLDPAANHVVPALMQKAAKARRDGTAIAVWGSGRPRREFLFVDDAADAMVFLMEHWSEDGIINIGAGEDVSIAELAARVAAVVGHDGRLAFDDSKPDGMPRKLLHAERLLALGWRPRTTLEQGLEQTWNWLRTATGEGR